MISLGLIVSLIVRHIINLVKPITDRYMVREIISKGQELPLWKWFNIKFLKGLSGVQLLTLLGLASWTLITFPVGVWVNSFTLKVSVPISSIMSYVIMLFFFPLNLFLFNRALKEFAINRTTILGVVIVEISIVVAIIGWYIILRGNAA